MNKILLAAAALVAVNSATAAVKVSGIFSDDMVLQRGKPVPVWGTAEPGEEVKVAFAGKTAAAKTGSDGRFKVVLPALDVLKTGGELTVEGANKIVFKNVVVGDVWLVSGQSNSEMSFSWGIINGKEEMAKAKDYPNIRAVKFRHETSLFPSAGEPCCGKWVVATEKTLGGITAEGYFMAREINAKTGIPIGILDDNWSGCRIEPFVCAEGLRLVPELKNDSDGVVKARAAMVDWCCRIAAHKEDGRFDQAGRMPSGGGNWTVQHNAMIEPIVDFPICGATWYQGCSNGNEGMSYAKKLEALIGGWRAKWGYEFPFYIVQLASYTAKTDDPAGGNGYAKIRNAMRIAAQTIPKTGLAVAIDIGNAKDIHPKNKYDVGYRLSLWARRDVYGEKDLVVSGPLYKSMKVEDGKIRLSFDHVGSGLMAAEKGPDTPGIAPTPCELGDDKLKGFAIAGADQRWYWANAEIDGKDVVVSAEEVPVPVAVRYAFRANPMGDCNLYNKEGLPASPFRTDDW